VYFIVEGIYFSDVSVVKFGGSSLGTVKRLKRAAKLVANKCSSGEKLVVVTSAMGKTTDDLVKIINESSLEESSDIDEILAMGERTSIRVFKAMLRTEGVEANFLDLEHDEWPIITNNNYGDADILLDETEDKIRKTIASRLRKVDVLIVPGFVGKDSSGRITTIGRGGSDATALVIGGAINAKEVILCSDIDGIMTADPKLIKNPVILSEINVEKLTGIADSGRKFIKKKALAYKKDGVPLRLINSSSETLDADGTKITGSICDISVDVLSDCPISSVTVVGDGLSSNPGLLAGFLNIVHDQKVNLEGLSANHDSIVFYGSNLNQAYKKLHDQVIKNPETIAISRRDDLGAIVLNGIGLQETPGSMSIAANALKENGINIFGQYTVMSQIFLIVGHDDLKRARDLLEDELVSVIRGKDNG
jgi:aspartate kinase